MIPRYARPEMTAIWSPETRYSIWLEIETLAMEAMAELGTIPKSAAETYRAKGKFDVERIDEIEREVKHDVIAFLTSVAEHVGPDARFAHQGMTSSDVLDTCLAVQLARACDLLIAGNDRVLAALKKRAFEFKLTPTIGRSHGIHAEPTTFGLKLAGHYAEFARNAERLKQARKEIATCAISGAVGTFAQIDPRVEAYVADKLGLAVEPVSTQVIPRDRHAMFFATLGVVAAGIERLATEIRHLQRTEVLEAEEFFEPGQKGSSAMPHKRNPVSSMIALSTGVRTPQRVASLLAAMPQAHERGLGDWQAELAEWPGLFIAAHGALLALNEACAGLEVDSARMLRNIDALQGLVFAGGASLALAAHIGRKRAFALLEELSRQVVASGRPLADFLHEAVAADPALQSAFDRATVDALFDPRRATAVSATVARAAVVELRAAL